VTVRGLAIAAVFVIGGFVASSALAQHERTQRCSTREGSVSGYLPTAGHSCSSTILVGGTLFRAEIVSTGLPGQLTFHTTHLYRCRESSLAGDILVPTPAIAIQHLRGVTWCRHRPDDPKTWLKLKNAIIRINGTIVGLSTDLKGSIVKVAEGSAVVTSPTLSQGLLVPENMQLFIPIAGPPQKPTSLDPTSDDRVAIAEMRYDVVETGKLQSPELFRAQGERYAVVIGTNLTIADSQRKALGAKAALLTVSQVQANPQVVARELRRLGTHSIFTVGSFASLELLWSRLREKANLPAGTAIVYVSR
jgi:hypothetical protein